MNLWAGLTYIDCGLAEFRKFIDFPLWRGIRPKRNERLMPFGDVTIPNWSPRPFRVRYLRDMLQVDMRRNQKTYRWDERSCGQVFEIKGKVRPKAAVKSTCVEAYEKHDKIYEARCLGSPRGQWEIHTVVTKDL